MTTSETPVSKTPTTALASLSASLLTARDNLSSRLSRNPLPVIDELESAGTPPAPKRVSPPSPSFFAAVHVLERTMNLSEKKKIYSLIGLLSLATVGRSISEFLLIRTVTRLDVGTGNLLSFFPLAISAQFLSQISAFLQQRLSGEIKYSLTQSIIANLILKTNSTLDAEKIENIFSEISSLASAVSSVFADRLKKISDLLLTSSLFLVKRNFRSFLLAAYLVVAHKIAARPKKQKISDDTIKRAAVRLLRHREAIGLWDGRDREIGNFAKLVDSNKSAIDISDSKSFFVHSLLHKVGGPGLAMALAALTRKNPQEISEYLWMTRLMTSAGAALTGLLEDDSATEKIHAMALKLKRAIIDIPALETRKNPEAPRFTVHDQSITLCDVTLAMPDGSGVLFKDLSVEIFPGKTLLVSGPRGAGKSALAKIIMGVWEPTLGQVCRPESGVAVVPQRPYILAEATLKEQVTYPVGESEADNDRLMDAIHVAKIQNLFPNNLSKTTSLTADADQTRLMFARLLYHNPRFALLDDCVRSGGVDADALLEIVRHLKSRGTAVIVFASSSAAETLRGRFEFDAELKLNAVSGKQPPRHELVFNSATSNNQ